MKNENIISVLWHSVNGNYTEKDMQRLIKMLSRTYGHYVNTYEEDDNKYTDFDRLTYQWFDDSLSVDLWAILDRDNHKKINSLHISWRNPNLPFPTQKPQRPLGRCGFQVICIFLMSNQ